MHTFVLTVAGPAARGIVAAISGFVSDAGCNIVDSSQFDDPATAHFFMRVSFQTDDGISAHLLLAGLQPIAEKFRMRMELHDRSKRSKVMVMVSRFSHCLNDLLYRWRIGALPIDIAAVVSNHCDCQTLVVSNDIPFYHIPVTKENKLEAEARIQDIVSAASVELIVLARYMQVLSDTLCARMAGRIINIHHSFLPSFKGANPYKQAYHRGVKLIGATAHYVTADLDEGPIIEQDTVRVTHAQSAEDYVALGRDVEAQVLARAVHAHTQHRVFLSGGRTILFPASPGSYASERIDDPTAFGGALPMPVVTSS